VAVFNVIPALDAQLDTSAVPETGDANSVPPWTDQVNTPVLSSSEMSSAYGVPYEAGRARCPVAGGLEPGSDAIPCRWNRRRRRRRSV
jgi:hypothetical protein